MALLETLFRIRSCNFKPVGIFVGLALFLHVTFTSLIQADESVADFEEELAFKQAIEKVAPSVLQIETVGGLDRVGERVLGNGPTTGLVIDADGWILTSSFNFTGRPTEILVTLPNGERTPARTVATDQSCHLTLLKVEASNLPVPTAAPADDRRIGMWTLAIGRSYPQGVPSLSTGILSAVDRIHGKALQTDAKVSPVNYGGPLINLRGEVLGLLVPLSPDGKNDLAGVEWYDSGIGFAIPLDRIQRVLPRLQAGEDLRSGLAGFTIRASREDDTTVERVRFRSPAFEAGIRTGDVILEVDNQLVRRDSQIRQVLGRKYAGETARLKYRRGSDAKDVELMLTGELEPYELPLLGILLEKSEGAATKATVRAVLPNSPALNSGIRSEDRIVGWNGSAVSSIAELKSKLYASAPGEEVELELNRRTEILKLKLKLDSGVNSPPASGPALRSPSTPPKVTLTQSPSDESGRGFWSLEPTDVPVSEIRSLVVWLHPPGNPLESTAQEAWSPSCDAGGTVLIGPKLNEARRWEEDDAEFLIKLIEAHRQKYGLTRERVVLQSGPGTGAFAMLFARKFPEGIGAVILPESDFNEPLPELEPETAVRICLIRGPETDETHLTRSVEQLRASKYPHFITPESSEPFPTGAVFKLLSEWVDSLDQL